MLVEDKHVLMRDLGKRQLTLQLQNSIHALPPDLADYHLELSEDGCQIMYRFDSQAENSGIPRLLRRLIAEGIDFKDLQTTQSSLEEIFVSLVEQRR